MARVAHTGVRKKRIGILMGGISAEREISLRTGHAIGNALLKKKYSVSYIDVNKKVAQSLVAKKIEVAFIALHGRGGEDGTIQGLLEVMQIPYTGSGVLASSLALHKGMTKKILRYHRLPTADFQIIKSREITSRNFHQKIEIPLPVVVKPASEGSTIGTSVVTHKRNLRTACKHAAQFDQDIVVERFIEGKEITAGIVNGKPLPLIEIVPRTGFYSFQSKYTPGATDYLVPARIKKALALSMQQLALNAYRTVGCEGVARVDFMLSYPQNHPYILEVNTIPGMTETSLLPMAALHVGIDFNNLVEMILTTARLKEMVYPRGGSTI
jgi:D-alanine-D-alanine ligase